MGYFRELPDVQYQSFLSDAISSQDYLKVKNLFRRNKLRDDLQNVFTLFNKYEIVEGARPDTVAEEFYGKADLDWVVLMTAGIINVRNEWPLSDRQIYNYSLEIYGTQLNDVHHYEIPQSSGPTSSRDFSHMVECNADEDNVSIISNRQYEERKQDEYRQIRLLDPQFLETFIEEFESLIRG